MTLSSRRHDVEIAGQRLEGRWIGPSAAEAPTLVLLHEGLGCVGLWGEFPQKLAAAAGCGVFAFSRAGYGRSDPTPLPRPLSYMHDEARETLPAVLDAIGFRRGALVGHSDGASIALIHAGAVADPRVEALVAMAPHVFVEDISVASIEAARRAYEQGDLRRKLARWHDNVDCAFHGWNGAWLDPRFRAWDITELLPGVRVPTLLVQGEADQYGTIAQVRAIEQASGGPTETALLPDVGHSPHREAGDSTLRAIARFIARELRPENAK